MSGSSVVSIGLTGCPRVLWWQCLSCYEASNSCCSTQIWHWAST